MEAHRSKPEKNFAHQFFFHSFRRIALLVIAATLSAMPVYVLGHGSLFVDDEDPQSDGWTLVGGAGTVGPHGSGSSGEWQIEGDATGVLYYELPGGIPNRDWELFARIQIHQLNDSLDQGAVIEIRDGQRSFSISFGTHPDGTTLVKLVNGGTSSDYEGVPTTTIPDRFGSPNELLVQMDYSGSTRLATVKVNSLELTSTYAGFPSTADTIRFGNVGSSKAGGMRSEYFSFFVDLDDDGWFFSDADSDGDGIPNRMEELYGFEKYDESDGAFDLDTDGADNVSEYRTGTDLADDENKPSDLTNRYQKVFASDGSRFDRFGLFGGAIDGDLAVVGAPEARVGSFQYGAIYIYRKTNGIWQAEEKLTSPITSQGYFGYSPVIQDNKIFVGAPERGQAFEISHNGSGWIISETISRNPPFGANNGFGRDLDISNNVLAVGAFADNSQGAVDMFRFDGSDWQFEQTLTSPTPTQNAKFGISVALHNNLLIVGAPNGFTNDVQTGVAHIYEYLNGTWVHQSTLIPNDLHALDKYGTDVTIYGNFAIVGAPDHNATGDDGDDGAAYVFKMENGAWIFHQKISSPTVGGFTALGKSVSASGNFLAVGDNEGNLARIYRLVKGTYVEASVLKPGISTPGSHGFGIGVSLKDSKLVVSPTFDFDLLPFDGNPIYSPGAAYIFELDSDQDGLLNDEEHVLGTNISNADSDMDGVTDGDEVNYDGHPLYTPGADLDPLISDTDGDGVSDGDEIAQGTNPLVDASTVKIPSMNKAALVLLALGVVVVARMRLKRLSRLS